MLHSEQGIQIFKGLAGLHTTVGVAAALVVVFVVIA